MGERSSGSETPCVWCVRVVAPSSLLMRCVAVPRSSRRSPLERSISHPLADRFCSPRSPRRSLLEPSIPSAW